MGQFKNDHILDAFDGLLHESGIESHAFSAPIRESQTLNSKNVGSNSRKAKTVLLFVREQCTQWHRGKLRLERDD